LAYLALKKDARLSPGQSVLILGGHRGVGVLAIQMAKYFITKIFRIFDH
jgi:NADPH:quinone reductase-like Zn-dependent oxidoreductase